MAAAPQKKRTREPQEVRRKALINATIEVIAEMGLSNVTSQKVATAADMTAAMVNFHFSGKTALLHATLKHIADEFIDQHKEALKDSSKSPQETLEKLVRVSLSDSLSDYRKIAVWYAFYSEARSREDYTKICNEHDDAYYEFYHDPIRQLCDNEPRKKNARSITLGLIGILEHAAQSILVDHDHDRNEYIEDCLSYLDAVFEKW
ncbi:MAG: TetR/AcrR family transcriptional regulator [Alphaproteobacteria bacterium]|nr:TetR/AcrR family transcriptional regulator [Alphaproteobacteria bacterium]